jgi:pectate lyase
VGGGDATPVVVTSAGELTSAAAGTEPAVIHINGSISGDISIGSNKTIVGVCGAEVRGSLRMSSQQNVIMRNFGVIGHNCGDNPGDCSEGADAIGVRSSHHLWFDHLEVSDGSDGNLDMTNNSDYITISWTKFFYSTARSDPQAGASGHRFSNLIAGSDTDSGEYRITFHHNWWAENVDQRMPRTRFGDIHVFNNLFTSSGNAYCTNAGFSTRLLVENNVYRGVNNPLSPDGNGDMRAQGNLFDATSGNTSDNGGTGFAPPYTYDLDPTDGLDTLLQAEVGPHD